MREVKPTQKPVPSSDVKDLFFNSGKIDEWVNSLQHEYTDRFGKCHKTAAGMEWVFNQLVERFKIESEQALLAAGYAPTGTFQEGAEVVSRNGTVLWKLPDGDGDHYRWDGDLPKQVPAGSTPQSTGGIGKGAWVSVGDASLRGDLLREAGAGLIGTSSGLTVQQSINRRFWHAEDFLPAGFALDGSISYTTQLQLAISMAASAGVILVMPNFEVLIDPAGTEFGGLDVPSGAHIIFDKKSKLRIKANDLENYELLSIRDKSNITIENPQLVGDKYTHTGTAGEWGVCIAIRGMCNDINIINPKIDEAWGDGIYIGQIQDTVESTPKNVKITNPVINRCRRQGISVTSADGLTIDNPVINYTSSSDSAAYLPAGPHAGIDIEPNSFNSVLNNIKINNISGKDNDAGLFYIFLGGIEKQYPVGGVYNVDVTVDGLSDVGSLVGLQLAGLSKNVTYSGAVFINKMSSLNPKRNGIRARSWSPAVPVIVDGCSITNWHNDTSTAAIDTAPISVYQNTDSNFPAIGGLRVNDLILKNNKDSGSISENMVFTSSTSTAGVEGVFIALAVFDVPKTPSFVQSQAGSIDFRNLRFGKGIIQHRESSWTQSIGISTDIIVNHPTAQITMTLPNVATYEGVFEGYRFRVVKGTGGYPTFRFRKGDVPLYFNGVSGGNFLVSSESGVVDVEFDGIAFYATSKGTVSKES
ncbi:tail fiber/spike domain-containing protein [Providencia huashanensis]|uniref:tail fiber/spike domain-containing protein n=1 Tax=Providencia huashanensis TaxID=3037798 RepID=UPI002AFFE072|nr:right-handed parallel beta-helix repeat-containing protein [Providencia sp. 23021821]